jgi:hypothetical protein
MVGYAGKSLIVIAMVMFASLKTYFYIVPNQRELGLKIGFFILFLVYFAFPYLKTR